MGFLWFESNLYSFFPSGLGELIAKLAYNFVDYSLWMFMVEISIVCGAFTANITGRHLE